MNPDDNIKPIPHPKSWTEALIVVPPVLLDFKPLALGTREALYLLRAPGVSKKAIGRMIARHADNIQYHKSVLLGDDRFALSGAIDGKVEPSHKARAQRILTAVGQ